MRIRVGVGVLVGGGFDLVDTLVVVVVFFVSAGAKSTVAVSNGEPHEDRHQGFALRVAAAGHVIEAALSRPHVLLNLVKSGGTEDGIASLSIVIFVF